MTKQKWDIAAPEGCYAAIGRVVTQFALLENQLAFCVKNQGGLVGHAATLGDCIVSELTFRGLLGAFEALVRERYTIDAVAEIQLKRTLALVRESNDLRNRVCHSLWSGHAGPDTIHRLKFRNRGKSGFVVDSESLHEQDLLALVGTIADATDRLMKLTLWLMLRESDDKVPMPFPDPE